MLGGDMDQGAGKSRPELMRGAFRVLKDERAAVIVDRIIGIFERVPGEDGDDVFIGIEVPLTNCVSSGDVINEN